jgi:hypothetical protein
MARVSLQLKEWNAEKLLAKTERVLEQLGPIYAAEADRQVTSVKWFWPNQTVRRFSREVVGSPRDIVDSGTLLRSRQEPQVKSNAMTIKWAAPYALNVAVGKYGSYIGAGGEPVQPPQIARNWIDATYQALPAVKLFAEKWRVTK